MSGRATLYTWTIAVQPFGRAGNAAFLHDCAKDAQVG